MYEKQPKKIESTSMDIIDTYLADVSFSGEQLPIIKRMIHTTGDVDYRHIVDIHPDFVARATRAIREGVTIYTDTNMGRAGVNKRALARSGCALMTCISDEDVAECAEARGTTRSIVAIEKAVRDGCRGFMIGNAPTALFRLLELCDAGKVDPEFIIAVPVGFVGAAESKEKMGDYDIPYIRTLGTKGGSNVAASVLNALLYEVAGR
ncbi:MAG: precorrin-8X methylmutase [Peptoniphilus sp.]|nr:precorrin-8X methylmutase [Peptoniphilus sp.]MDD7363716.1 precorrin-8X methylmutase [Bacillota bacterium]MDY6044101.1 precorrin-8X methylmutase [Peptoniphilus sp.]